MLSVFNGMIYYLDLPVFPHYCTVLVKTGWTPNLPDEVFQQDYDGLRYVDSKHLFIDLDMCMQRFH